MQKQKVVNEDNERSSIKWSASSSKSKALDSDNNNKQNPKKPLVSSTTPGSEESGVSRSNLERFLESTRPSVPVQYFPKVDIF